MDLREKLSRMGPAFPQRSMDSRPRIRSDIHVHVCGEMMENERGAFFHAVEVYPFDHCHGEVPVGRLLEVDPSVFGIIGRDPALGGLDMRRALFLDTETTGLAGGTGTLPFLIGLGTYADNGFRVEQLFMRDWDEEQAVLEELRSRFEKAECLVSYNGRAFDMSLIHTRFLLSRMRNPALNLPHLDLLYPARRMWRRRLGDCSLTSIEKSVLGFERAGDIPGFLIPSLYFEYVRTGRAGNLAPVFRHNRWDIVALAALSGLMGLIHMEPEAHVRHAPDWISLGRSYEQELRIEQASVCYRQALDLSPASDQRAEILSLLGFAFKRSADWTRAVEVWEQLAQSQAFSITPYEELAKYYEHRAANYQAAADIVRRALARISVLSELRPEQYLEDRKDLEYRLARLERKSRKSSRS
ncbi:ribonuclease H-like domain-containing protein [bacterium]|nr:ribonuclease H-like domain-containing protein [bacterium]